jgi:hypothetical protein
MGRLFESLETNTMNEDQYFAAARRFGLKPTNVPGVWATSTGEFHNVPDASRMTPDQRAETIEVLKRLLGIGSAP